MPMQASSQNRHGQKLLKIWKVADFIEKIEEISHRTPVLGAKQDSNRDYTNGGILPKAKGISRKK